MLICKIDLQFLSRWDSWTVTTWSENSIPLSKKCNISNVSICCPIIYTTKKFSRLISRLIRVQANIHKIKVTEGTSATPLVIEECITFRSKRETKSYKAKAKRIQHHKTNITTNAKGNALGRGNEKYKQTNKKLQQTETQKRNSYTNITLMMVIKPQEKKVKEKCKKRGLQI